MGREVWHCEGWLFDCQSTKEHRYVLIVMLTVGSTRSFQDEMTPPVTLFSAASYIFTCGVTSMLWDAWLQYR